MSKSICLITTIILIIFAILFYWYSYRSSVIKKTCAEAVKRGGNYDLEKEFGFSKDGFYQDCLRIKGL